MSELWQGVIIGVNGLLAAEILFVAFLVWRMSKW
jgi:hypothetical protein